MTVTALTAQLRGLEMRAGLLGACAGLAVNAIYVLSAARVGGGFEVLVDAGRRCAVRILRDQGLSHADATAKVKAALPKPAR